MKVDYNPQLGYRRTIFHNHSDFLTRPLSYEVSQSGLEFTVETDQGKQTVVRVFFLTDTAFRFQMFPEGSGNIPRNPIFSIDAGAAALFEDKKEYYEYGTETLKLRFQKNYWEMSVYSNGELLTKEQAFDTNVDNRWKCLPTGYRTDEAGNRIGAWETMYLFSDESFWGFGEKFTNLNKRGQLLHCWQRDALSTNTEDSYKAHPFFVSSRGYAVLLNTFTRCSFDMGHSSQVSYQMYAEDGYLDYLLLAEGGGDYKSLLQQYLKLTGPIPMIPKWAFGYWTSKCTYRTRQEIEQVVSEAAAHEIPLDVIHIDGWQNPENTGLWEWDTKRFPDPEGMIRWLNERHIHLSLWMYPYLSTISPMFAQLEEKGYFIKNKEGRPALFYSTADAPHQSACFDFTNPEFLEWYKPRVMSVLRMGVSVIKTDFSEAVPEDAVFYDGSSGIEGHNRLTYLYAETIYRWMEECCRKSGTLPMLWGRSGYAGSHRIPAAWAGDSSCALNNHSAILRAGLGMAMSGVSFWGFDMGGFYNTAADGNECPPTEEEYLRSVELGFFMPLSRTHGKTPREPWNFSEKALDCVRNYDRLRHEMVPYLYHLAGQSHAEGIPMLRPLLLEYPKDDVARTQELSFMLGDSLLIAPPFERKRYAVYLPEGKWLDYFSDEILEGGQFIPVQPELDELPVFQRENTVILKLQREELSYVPEGRFSSLRGRLFYCGEFDCVWYDEGEGGALQAYSFHAYTTEKDPYLHIDTELDICQIELISDRTFEGICLNGVILPENRTVLKTGG